MDSKTTAADICAGRLSKEEYARNFSDSHTPLNRVWALIEADRCYYCYDVFCTTACFIGIDIFTFIQRIAQDNVRGAVKTILDQLVLIGIAHAALLAKHFGRTHPSAHTAQDVLFEDGLVLALIAP